MKPKISIIIPVFNAEKYLKECLDSVLKQTFKDFEVILINDGSTDSSGLICDEYAQADSRLSVFHKENGGVSAARNLGLENASGEWITFIDSDDYIAQNYFLVLEGKDPTSDFILMEIFRLKKDNLIKIVEFPNGEFTAKDFIETWTVYPSFPGPYSKFFKNIIIRQNGLKFNDNLSFGEDALFNLNYLAHCKSVLTSNFSSYHYRDTPNGLSKVSYEYDREIYFYNEIKNAVYNLLNKKPELTNPYVSMRYLEVPILRVLLSIYTSEKKINSFHELNNFLVHNDYVLKYVYNKANGFAHIISFLLNKKCIRSLDLFFKFYYYIKL